jgi:hypothetical protein
MRRSIPVLVPLLLTSYLLAQDRSTDEREAAAIERVRTLLVSSLDRDLPKVTLDFFLSYEGQGAPIQWKVNHCGEPTGDKAGKQGHDSAMCVQADIGLRTAALQPS